jgi:hypothetical protein
VFAQAYSCPRKKLAAKQVPENGRNVRRFADLVHGADLPSEHKFYASRKRIHVWCGDHRGSSGCEKTADVAEETDGTFDVFDDLDGRNQIEGSWTESGGEVILIKIEQDVGQAGFESFCSSIDSHNIAAEGMQSFGYCSRARTQVSGTHARERVSWEHAFCHELMESFVGGRMHLDQARHIAVDSAALALLSYVCAGRHALPANESGFQKTAVAKLESFRATLLTVWTTKSKWVSV